MRARELQLGDFLAIDKIWRSFYSLEFGLPPVDADTLYSTTVEHKGEVVGFGQIRRTAESVMVIDQSLRMRDKVEIIKRILEKQIEGMIVREIKECHAFAQNPNFALMLRKHFHYTSTEGESLVLRLENLDGWTEETR